MMNTPFALKYTLWEMFAFLSGNFTQVLPFALNDMSIWSLFLSLFLLLFHLSLLPSFTVLLHGPYAPPLLYH